MSPSLPADGKIGGLLSRDRPSGSVTGSLEGLRGLLGGGGGGGVAVLLQSPSFFFFSALFSLRSKKQMASKVSSLFRAETYS